MNAVVTPGKAWVPDELLDYDKLNLTATPSVEIEPQAAFFGSTAGSVNAYVATLTPAATELSDGLAVKFRVDYDNTGASTVNVSGLGAFAIKKGSNQALVAGDLRAGQIVEVVWDASLSLWWLESYIYNPGMNSPVGTAASGSTTTYTVTLSGFPAALAHGLRATVKIDVTNTGASTLNVNSLGAKKILQQGTLNLAAGMMGAGQYVDVQYDSAGDAGAGAWQLLSGASAGAALLFGASATGVDAYAFSQATGPTVLTDGLLIWFRADVANTGACTLNYNATGVKAIKKGVVLDLTDGDIRAGGVVPVVYDLVNGIWQLQTQLLAQTTAIYSNLSSLAGTDTYVCAAVPPALALVEGMQVWFRADVANAGAATLNFCGLGAKQIVRRGGVGLSDNDIAAATVVGLVYDAVATQWVLIDSPQAAAVTKYSALDTAALSVNFAADGTLVKGHGLGAAPAMARAVLVCLSAELGYAVNEELDAQNASTITAAPIFCVAADASNVTVTVSAVTTYIMPKGSSAYTAIDRAKWKLKLYAWI